MASTKEYKDYVLEQLEILDSINCRPMMGEYLLYYRDTLFGGIYDDRLLVKKTNNNKIFDMGEVIPYKNAKPMYFVDNIDDSDNLRNIIITTYKDLK